jgi:hypothetical protein
MIQKSLNHGQIWPTEYVISEAVETKNQVPSIRNCRQGYQSHHRKRQIVFVMAQHRVREFSADNR